MLDISFYVKIMILLSSFPVIYLFLTLLPDLYFFSFCSLNISLSCDTTMTKRTLKWSGHTIRRKLSDVSVSRNEIQNATWETKVIFWKISHTDIYSQRTV